MVRALDGFVFDDPKLTPPRFVNSQLLSLSPGLIFVCVFQCPQLVQ